MRSHRHLVALAFSLYTVVADAAQHRAEASSPQSFYIAIHSISDASPFWFDYVLDVSKEHDIARVALLRVGAIDPCADAVIVKAEQASIPIKALNRLTKGMCKVRNQQVQRAVAESKPHAISSVFESASYGIVERCGEREEVIGLPLPEDIDQQKMHRNYPNIERLWHLASSLFQAAFNGNPLSSDHGLDTESQRAAEPFIARLRSGAFDRGFSETELGVNEQPWSTVLNDYHGIVTSLPSFAGEAQNIDTLGLDHYVGAAYPPLAKQARIQGDVKVTFHVDEQTGEVNEAEALEGPEMLRQSALNAVRQWRFKVPLADSTAKATTTIRFSLSCPTS
jgi:TonB family protein